MEGGLQLTRGAKWLLGLGLLLCFGQFTRSIDFKGYLEISAAALAGRFREIPYPVEKGYFGAYFQSPVLTLLFVPFTKLPLLAAKFLWALLSTAGVIWAFRSVVFGRVDLKLALFFLLVFAHPLSDVYLSANVNFLILCLCLAGWRLLDTRWEAAGGLCLGLAILVKVQPALFLVWFLVQRRWRAASWIVTGVVAWFAFTSLFLPADRLVGWWSGWGHAVGLYHQAAYAGAVSYQSPPAALFRTLVRAGLPYESAWRATGVFSIAIQGALFGLAWIAAKRKAPKEISFALLLSAFFLGVPFSWAQTVLFVFPLIYLGVGPSPKRFPWTAAILLAAIPKALWPEPVWNRLAEGNLPAACLAILCGYSLWKILYRPSARLELVQIS